MLTVLTACALLRAADALTQTSPPASQPSVAPAAIVADSSFDARVVSRAEDSSTIELSQPDGGGGVTWRVANASDVRAQVATFNPGDRVTGIVRTENNQISITKIKSVSVVMSSSKRLTAFIVPLALLIAFAQFMIPGGAKWLFIGEDNRYSTSKTQGALWFLTLICSYSAVSTLRYLAGGGLFLAGVEMPSNLLWLSGISALTFVGAKQIVTARIDATTRSAVPVKSKSPVGPRFRDLVTDDSGTRGDLGDFQMLVITIIAVIVYSLTMYTWMARITLHATVLLPDVDSTLLGTFGLGQAAYLTKKLVGDSGKTAEAGPIITTRPPQPTMLQRRRPL